MFKTKTKAVLILISTLVLGIIIGVLGSRYIVEKRIGRMAGMRYQEGFIEVFITLIDPAEDQEQAVRAVLKKHHDRFLKIMESRMGEIRTSMDSVYSELTGVLTEDQLQGLAKHLERPGFPRGPWDRGKRGAGPWHKGPPPLDDNDL